MGRRLGPRLLTTSAQTDPASLHAAAGVAELHTAGRGAAAGRVETVQAQAQVPVEESGGVGSDTRTAYMELSTCKKMHH